MKNFKLHRLWIPGISLLMGLFAVSVAFFSEGVQNAGDGIQHYFISRYSWQHPELFLDHWGKPLFTLLSSPFAQMGFTGMVVFNASLFLLTTYFLTRLAASLKLGYKWLIPFLIMLCPAYYRMLVGGMTEILFATVFIASIYFLHNRKYVIGAIIFSFILFTRPESLVVFPFVLIFVLLKSPRHLPLLATGFVVYGLAGWAHYGSFFWFFTESPYGDAKDIYGSGELLHYVYKSKDIFGKPIGLAILAGIIALVVELVRSFNKRKASIVNNFKLSWSTLILLPFLAVFAAHSYLWWKGLKGSLGMIRVIATIVPLGAILALFLFNRVAPLVAQLQSKLNKKVPYSLLLTVFLLVAFIQMGLKINLPITEKPEERALSNAAEWYKKQGYEEREVYYLHPYFAYKAGINPFDEDKVSKLWSLNKSRPSEGLEEGTIIAWDEQFGPNAGKLLLEALQQDSSLVLVHAFFPDKRVKTLGNRPFGVYLFEVERNRTSGRGKEKKEVLKSFDETIRISADEEFHEFVRQELSAEGIVYMDLQVSMEVLFPENYADKDFQLVVSHNTEGKANYLPEKIILEKEETGHWKELDFSFKLNAIPSELVVYIWNYGKKNYQIRNVQIVLEKH